jgi:hypothetical protein
MKKTNSKKSVRINEDVSLANISLMSYIVFIDIASFLLKGNGLLSSMFSSKAPERIAKWFGKIKSEDAYTENEDAFKAVSSRFMGNPILKKLYSSIDKLKTVSTGETDESDRDKDIEKLLGKVGLFIKGRLTKQEQELVGKLSTSLSSIGNNISSSIKSDLEQMTATESPERAEEPKTEIKVNERLKNKLRKKIKEIIRTQMAPTQLPPEKPFLHQQTLHDIAALIRKDWKNVYFGAKPYLDAMSKLTNISDRYGADNAKTIVLYFLANASTWRGDTARAVKAHLKSLVK